MYPWVEAESWETRQDKKREMKFIDTPFFLFLLLFSGLTDSLQFPLMLLCSFFGLLLPQYTLRSTSSFWLGVNCDGWMRRGNRLQRFDGDGPLGILFLTPDSSAVPRQSNDNTLINSFLLHVWLRECLKRKKAPPKKNKNLWWIRQPVTVSPHQVKTL